MKRILLCAALLAASSGCITVTPFTPGSPADKGMWISKGKALGPLQFGDPEILYCSNNGSPVCNAAKQNSELSGVKVVDVK